jgi:O-antigen ligase
MQISEYRASELTNRILLFVAASALGLVAAFLGLMFPAKIVIGLLLGLFFGALIVLRPIVGVGFLLVVIPLLKIFPPAFLGAGFLNPLNLILVWVTVAILLHRWVVLRIGLSRRSFVLPVVMYVAVLVFAIVVSLLNGGVSFLRGADMARTYINGAYVYFLVVNVIDEEKHARRIFAVILVTVALTALWGLSEYRSSIAGGGDPSRVRISGRVGQPNEFGAFLAVYLPFLVGVTRYGIFTTRQRVLAGIGAAAVFFALLFTQSRGAYLAAALALGVMAVAINRRLLLLFVLAGVTAHLWLPSQVSQRVRHTFVPGQTSDGKYDASTESRLLFYRAGLEMFADSPIWGHGLGSFGSEIYRRGFTETRRDSHSLYIQMLSEAGIIGIGILFWLFLFLARLSRRLWRRSTDPFHRMYGECFLVSLLALVVVNAFGVRFYNYINVSYFWALTAILVRFSAGVPATGAEGRVRLGGSVA